MKRTGIDVELLRALVIEHRQSEQKQREHAKKFRVFAPDFETEEEAQQYLQEVWGEYTGHIERLSQHLLEEYGFYVEFGGLPFDPENDKQQLDVLAQCQDLVNEVNDYIFLLDVGRKVFHQQNNAELSYIRALKEINAIMKKLWPERQISVEHHKQWALHDKQYALYYTAAKVYTIFQPKPRTRAALQGTSLLRELPGTLDISLNEMDCVNRWWGLVARINKNIEKNGREPQTVSSPVEIEVSDPYDFTQEIFDEKHESNIKALLQEAGLSRNEQRVTELFLENFTETEISKELKRTVGTVRRHYFRAKVKLRRLFKSEKIIRKYL